MKKSGVFLVAASTVALLSCASAIDPYVPYPERTPKDIKALSESSSLLDNALARLYQTRNTLQDYAHEQARILAMSKGGVFGGGLGAIASGLYGGSRDLIVGFGLAGGGSYALGQLYGPAGYAAAYRSGLGAISCVEGAVTPSAGVFTRLRIHQKTLEKMHEGKLSDETKGAIKSTIGDLDKALAMEGALGVTVDSAVDQIIKNVNDIIEVREPDIASAAALVRSIGAYGLSGIPEAQKSMADGADKVKAAQAMAQQKLVLMGPTGVPTPPIDAVAEAAALAEIKKSRDDLQKTGDVAIKAIEASLATCKVSPSTPSVLMKRPSDDKDIEIAGKDTFHKFTITGGQAPYSAVFLGAPPKGLKIEPEGSLSWTGDFTVKATEAFTENGTVEIDIRDSNPKTPARLGKSLKVNYGQKSGDQTKKGNGKNGAAKAGR